jgi:predicted alpha/beta-hydrolase family hydrolase
MQTESRKIAIGDNSSISSKWIVPEEYERSRTALILAHGTGAGMEHEFIVDFQKRLSGLGLLTVSFNFPYKEQGRRFPDRPEVLEGTYTAVIEAVRQDSLSPKNLFIGGKSLGGRIASHLVAKGERVAGLLFLGYPLHPIGRPETIRTKHWPQLHCPVLFIQGSKDRLCEFPVLERELPRIPGETTLHLIERGNHSLDISKKLKVRDQTRTGICLHILSWMQEAEN